MCSVLMYYFIGVIKYDTKTHVLPPISEDHPMCCDRHAMPSKAFVEIQVAGLAEPSVSAHPKKGRYAASYPQLSAVSTDAQTTLIYFQRVLSQA